MNFRYKLMRFMSGRYGIDALFYVLFGVAAVLFIVNVLGTKVFTWVSNLSTIGKCVALVIAILAGIVIAVKMSDGEKSVFAAPISYWDEEDWSVINLSMEEALNLIYILDLGQEHYEDGYPIYGFFPDFYFEEEDEDA